MSTSNQKSNLLVQYSLIALCAFGLSALATILFNHWDVVNTLLYESSLAKYETMTGERGPTTYLIFHDNFAALETIAAKHEGILGVEQHAGSNVAKMAFVTAQSPLIEQVRQLATVSSMINRNVPMMCH